MMEYRQYQVWKHQGQASMWVASFVNEAEAQKFCNEHMGRVNDGYYFIWVEKRWNWGVD